MAYSSGSLALPSCSLTLLVLWYITRHTYIPCYTPHHTTLHHSTTQHNTQYHTMACHAMPCHAHSYCSFVYHMAVGKRNVLHALHAQNPHKRITATKQAHLNIATKSKGTKNKHSCGACSVIFADLLCIILQGLVASMQSSPSLSQQQMSQIISAGSFSHKQAQLQPNTIPLSHGKVSLAIIITCYAPKLHMH